MKRHATPPSVVELGCAGHLIVANRCRWKRHTQVGNYRVSSIGDYFAPDLSRIDKDPHAVKRDTIGAGEDAFFETMVFKTVDKPAKSNDGCGCREVAEWGEIDSEHYPTAGKAQAGHERFVAKYLKLARKEARRG